MPWEQKAGVSKHSGVITKLGLKVGWGWGQQTLSPKEWDESICGGRGQLELILP